MNMSRLPKVGLRMIKSAAAVFLCLLLNMARQGQGAVFYSCIAAVLCMQQDNGSSIRVGMNRVVGTLIGGLAGMLLLAGEQRLHLQGTLIHALLVSLGVLLIIYVTVLLNKKSASYISCVVFMSIVVSHVTDADPYLFAFNRILDTLIGIVVSFALNFFHLPRHREKDALFIVQDAYFSMDGKKPEALRSVRFKRLLDEGMNLTYSALLPPRDDSGALPYPLILFDGGALYEEKQRRYEVLHCFSAAQSAALRQQLQAHEAEVFTFFVRSQILHAYLPASPKGKEARALLASLCSAVAHACVIDRVPEDSEALMLGMVMARERADEISGSVHAPYARTCVIPCAADPDLAFLAVVPAQSDADEAADLLCRRIHAARSAWIAADERADLLTQIERMFYHRCDANT